MRPERSERPESPRVWWLLAACGSGLVLVSFLTATDRQGTRAVQSLMIGLLSLGLLVFVLVRLRLIYRRRR